MSYELAMMARRKALWAERKANEAAASSAPWAMRNLRLYQNFASKWWGEHYAEVRKEAARNDYEKEKARSDFYYENTLD